ncbi:MAG: RICIN domain-containing protein [Alphaproteobacteria bacterium]|nr:RICIN domain-containing protein [Alphaproteobacteria bacterium]
MQIEWFSPDAAKQGDRIFQCPVAQWLNAGSITVDCRLASIAWHPAEIIGVGGKCLDVTGASTDNGTAVEMWDCTAANNQQWTFSGGQILGLGGKCLDVRGAGTANGTAVQIWDCAGVANQQWNFINKKIFGFGGKCLDVQGGGTTNGTAVQMWDCATVANQNWSWH